MVGDLGADLEALEAMRGRPNHVEVRHELGTDLRKGGGESRDDRNERRKTRQGGIEEGR